jgi:hypothetical protein
MASSRAFSPPHSSDLCQKLALYKRDTDWWKKALEISPHVEGHIEGLLSMRARNWLLSRMALESLESSKSKTLRSLADYAIFDCTFGEARLAANAGCNFCLVIINRPTRYHKSDQDNEFLACSSRTGHFGILRREQGEREKKRLHMIPTSNGLFEILALFSKVLINSSPETSRSDPI